MCSRCFVKRRLVTDLGVAVKGLTNLANRDLRGVWQNVRTADQARNALVEVLPPLIDSYSAAATSLAADWYDDSRVDADVGGTFRARPATMRNVGAEDLARWGVDPLYQAEPDWVAARTLVEGGMQRRIADAARETIVGSSVADPQSRGWRRITRLDGCTFCVILAERGGVYKEDTVRFASHDHCNCEAAPVWGGEPVQVPDYTRSKRVRTQAERDATYRYLAKHHAG